MGSADELTDTVEDYLKGIHKLQQEEGTATTSRLADLLDVSAASVSGMKQKLEDMNLVEHTPYEGMELTDHGLRIAMEVLRHHRLVERFLAEALDISWDRVHEEAEKLEHVLSEELEDRMTEFLDNPDKDPHGSPIPKRDGTIERPPCKPLSEMNPGETSVVFEVSDHDSNLLRYLGERDIYPGTPIELVSEEPYEGGVTIRVDGGEVTIGKEAARNIQVTSEPG